MKPFLAFLCLTSTLLAEGAIDPKRAASTVILDEIRVKNLRIETTEAEEGVFEETALALGRIEVIPANRSGVSSRVAGRIVALNVSVGDAVESGQEIAKLEARVPGNPPPILPLTATAKGVVTKVMAAVGEPLEPEASLLEITDLSEVFAIARVPDHVAGRLKPGTKAHITIAAVSKEPVDGVLLRFGTEANRDTGTVDALFKLTNAELALRPGMRAEFSLVLDTREGVTSVPRSALQGDAGNRVLYVKDFDLPNAFVKTPVVVGQMMNNRVEIVTGLLPGDEVVTRGAYSLAFAGGGSVSLKDALDAAHGHEHNDDGSELTAEQKAAKAAAGSTDADHGHSHSEGHGSLVWKIISGVLALMLLGQWFAYKQSQQSATK